MAAELRPAPFALPPSAGAEALSAVSGRSPDVLEERRLVEVLLERRWWGRRFLSLWNAGARVAEIQVSRAGGKESFVVAFLPGDEQSACDAACALCWLGAA